MPLPATDASSTPSALAPPDDDALAGSALSHVVQWYKAVPQLVPVGLAFAAAVIIGLFALSEIANNQIERQRQTIPLVAGVRSDLRLLMEELLRAESQHRIYLLTRDETFLPAFEHGVDSVFERHATIISRLGEPGRPFVADLVKLGRLLNLRIDEMRLVLNLANIGESDAAAARLKQNIGVEQTRQIEALLATLDDNISRQYQAATAEVGYLLMLLRIGTAILVVITLGFLALVMVQNIRHFQASEARRFHLAASARKLEATVAARTKELQQLNTYLQHQSERERAMLAQDLHDQFGALLTTAKVDLAWLQGRHAQSDDPENQQHLSQLATTLSEVVTLKRNLIEALHPSLLDHLSLAPALNWYVEQTCVRHGVGWELDMDDAELEADTALTLYRVAQEAIGLAIRQDHATKIALSLKESPDDVRLIVRDNGNGLSLSAIGPVPLVWVGLRYRVSAHGGELHLAATPNEGGRVEVRIAKTGV